MKIVLTIRIIGRVWRNFSRLYEIKGNHVINFSFAMTDYNEVLIFLKLFFGQTLQHNSQLHHLLWVSEVHSQNWNWLFKTWIRTYRNLFMSFSHFQKNLFIVILYFCRFQCLINVAVCLEIPYIIHFNLDYSYV